MTWALCLHFFCLILPPDCGLTLQQNHKTYNSLHAGGFLQVFLQIFLLCSLFSTSFLRVHCYMHKGPSARTSTLPFSYRVFVCWLLVQSVVLWFQWEWREEEDRIRDEMNTLCPIVCARGQRFSDGDIKNTSGLFYIIPQPRDYVALSQTCHSCYHPIPS
jgi:hypothetical protein